jgi:hypothetical protein
MRRRRGGRRYVLYCGGGSVVLAPVPCCTAEVRGTPEVPGVGAWWGLVLTSHSGLCECDVGVSEWDPCSSL